MLCVGSILIIDSIRQFYADKQHLNMDLCGVVLCIAKRDVFTSLRVRLANMNTVPTVVYDGNGVNR